MQMKIVHKLAACNAVSNESDLALADMAIKMRDLDTARKSLKAALEKRETVRTCQLWAALEKLESPGFDRGSPWLNRSLNAIPDSTWICNSCAQTVTEWHAHCPACEAFDTLEWKSRAMAFAG